MKFYNIPRWRQPITRKTWRGKGNGKREKKENHNNYGSDGWDGREEEIQGGCSQKVSSISITTEAMYSLRAGKEEGGRGE